MARKTDSAEDFYFLKDVTSWPTYPILPVKKSCNISGVRESFGYLLSQNGTVLPTVFIPDENGDTVKMVEYSSVEEALLHWDVIK